MGPPQRLLPLTWLPDKMEAATSALSRPPSNQLTNAWALMELWLEDCTMLLPDHTSKAPNQPLPWPVLLALVPSLPPPSLLVLPLLPESPCSCKSCELEKIRQNLDTVKYFNLSIV